MSPADPIRSKQPNGETHPLAGQPEPAARFLRVRDVARLASLSKSAILRAVTAGRLRAVRLEGALLLPVEAVEAWLGTAEPWNSAPRQRGAGRKAPRPRPRATPQATVR